MRALLAGAVLAVLIGCGVQKKEDPPAIIKLAREQTGVGVNPVRPPAPKSMLRVEYPKLWANHAPPVPGGGLKQFQELLHYMAEPEQCLAVELAGSGTAGPLAVAARIAAQPDVVKGVEAALAKVPLAVITLGGSMMDTTSSGFGGGENRRLVLGVTGTAKQAEAALARFAEEVRNIAKEFGATELKSAGGDMPYPKQLVTYTLPERSGTIIASLLLPDVKPEVVDAIIPPADKMARVMLNTREKDQVLLVVTVEEK